MYKGYGFKIIKILKISQFISIFFKPIFLKHIIGINVKSIYILNSHVSNVVKVRYNLNN